MINIRAAQASDLEIIQDLNQKLFAKEFQDFDNTLDLTWSKSADSTEYYQARIAGTEGCAFVAEVDDRVIGYLVGGPAEAAFYRTIKSGFAELENMYVEEEYRSQGIGQQLVDSFFDWCKANGIKRVRVIASAGNAAGINFYQRTGFFDWEVTLEKEIK